MTNTEAIKAIDAEIKRQEAELQRMREELAAITAQEERPINDRYLMDAVLDCPHTITAESVTLHFSQTQKDGHNALSQLRYRLAAYDLATQHRQNVPTMTNALITQQAARYRYLRDVYWGDDKEFADMITLQMNKIWDEKIDAAIAARDACTHVSVSATQQQPQSGRYQPNWNVQPPPYKIITESYDPYPDSLPWYSALWGGHKGNKHDM